MATTQTFDLAGAVKATNVPITRGTLPVFEAIANAIDAIEANGGSGRIEVSVERENTLLSLMDKEKGRKEARILGFTISDDGEGFTDENVSSFMSIFTTAKAEKGGRGIGRFTWFKTFGSVEITSHYREGDRLRARTWVYRDGDRELGPWSETPVTLTTTGSVVRLRGFKREYASHGQTPKQTKTLAYKVIEHFLSRFAQDALPTLIVSDDEESYNLHDECEQLVVDRDQDLNVPVGEGQHLRVRYLMMRFHSDLPGRIVYCAGSRGVVDEDPGEVVPDVPEVFDDSEGGQLSLRVYVAGDPLEKSNDPYRTTFNLDAGGTRQTRIFTDLPTWADIREAIRPGVERFVGRHIAGARAERDSQLDRHLEAAPWYRGLVAARPEVRERIPVNARGEALEVALYRESLEWRAEVHQKGARLLDELRAMDDNFDEARERIWRQQQSLHSEAVDDLARYVTHRRVVLDWLRKAVSRAPSGKYTAEGVVHDLFFKRGVDSRDLHGSYFNHNLWIIDDQLAFHRYAISDRRLDAHSAVEVDSKRRPDIAIYARAVVLERHDGASATDRVTIIEFKKPGREVYGTKDDPVDQVMDYVHLISAGHERDDDGGLIPVSTGTRYFGYVIADPSDDLDWYCQRKNMGKLANGVGFGQFFDKWPTPAYVEVLSFDSLLTLAERRNRAFFQILGINTPR